MSACDSFVLSSSICKNIYFIYSIDKAEAKKTTSLYSFCVRMFQSSEQNKQQMSKKYSCIIIDHYSDVGCLDLGLKVMFKGRLEMKDYTIASLTFDFYRYLHRVMN